ncbi:MAG: type II secretion system F family protein [Lachnospiraceae bacterium]|nr:type II secretion system F family protein [Lachnospiraceae bacterium]
MNYKVYHFTFREWTIAVCTGAGIAAGIAWIFYKSVLALPALIPIIFLYIRYHREEKKDRRLYELSLEFKEAILAVGGALSAGYSIENAFLSALADMEKLYGRDGLITGELILLSRRLKANENIEDILSDLSDRSGIEDIRDFADVFRSAKRNGGNLSAVIRRAADTISDKIEVRREIETLMSAKRFENRIMQLVPFGILCYIGLTSPDFIEPLYHNPTGVIIMTGCLALYAFAFCLSEKILRIQI